MLLLSLVVFGVTAWFLGLRLGGYSAVASFASLMLAAVVPSTALVVYAVHVAYIAGLVWAGPRASRWLSSRASPAPPSTAARAHDWVRRGRAFGEALWKSRRRG